MPRFQVTLVGYREVTTTVEVEAEDEVAADDLAFEMYEANKVVWAEQPEVVDVSTESIEELD